VIESKGTVRFLTRLVLAVALAAGVSASPVLAQSYGAALGSYLSLGGVERCIGPLIPANGIASTFRSELRAGVSASNVVAAKLVGTDARELNLEKAAPLENSPLRFDANANLRIWRLGLRAMYTNFDTRNKQTNLGRVDFTGPSLGADIDVVQFPWLSMGASGDYYFIDPTFQGVVHSPSLFDPSVTLEVKGKRPVTVGGYLRYIPPEILGFPLHIEAWFQAPIKGSKLKVYGGSLVFRPQIYRFDVAARILAEKAYLKFSNTPESQVSELGTIPRQDWEVDMEWNLVGMDFVVYF
jgi:hypothetical protein